MFPARAPKPLGAKAREGEPRHVVAQEPEGLRSAEHGSPRWCGAGTGLGEGRTGVVTSLGSVAGLAARRPEAGRAGCRRSRPPWPAAHCDIPPGARSQVQSAPRPAGGRLLKAIGADSTPNFPRGLALAAAGGG